MDLQDLLTRAPVLPVLTIERIDDSVPLARALVRGGLPVLEVTLRTDCALAAIRRIAEEVPEATVGAGTITRPADLDACAKAGARFAVSPGLSPALIRAAADFPLPLLPGVMTPSEALTAREAGFSCLKLFPAEPAGGRGLLRAMAGPLPELRFCPTGGIDAESFRQYLALPNVLCVGGSWVAPRAAIEQQLWDRIESLAREASR